MSGRDGGFTLAEALVSLFVFSLIAAGASALMIQSVESQRRASAAHEALREVQALRALLSADLAQIAPRGVREADGTVSPAFSGGSEAALAAFVRAGAAPDAPLGARTVLTRVIYRLEGESLVRESRSQLDGVDAETAAASPPARRVVLREAKAVTVRFYDGAAWSEVWIADAGRSLPAAIAIEAQAPRYGMVRFVARVGAGP